MQGNQDQILQGVEQTSILQLGKHSSTARHLSPGLRKNVVNLRFAWNQSTLINVVKSVYSLLRFVAGSSFSSSYSPNFPNYSSPKKSALVFTNYLRFHFLASWPKALSSRTSGYLS